MGDALLLVYLRLLAEILFVVLYFLILRLDLWPDLLIDELQLIEQQFDAAHPFLAHPQFIFSLLAECVQGLLPFVKPGYHAGKLLDMPFTVMRPSLESSLLADCRVRLLCKKRPPEHALLRPPLKRKRLQFRLKPHPFL